MKRDELDNLAAFVAVADESSFTRAASKLGMSPSALSHAMKGLEGRLGVRLLSRTTRSVSTTEAGERLLRTLRPAFEDIEAELTALGGLRDKPSGTVRITTFKHAATSVIMPVLPAFLTAHPNVCVEIEIDDGMTDIVASRFDAGIRFGESVAKDMIAVKVGPDFQIAVVGAPAYFVGRPPPVTPRDLSEHRCIRHRTTPGERIPPWPFQENGRSFTVSVAGPLVFSDYDLVVDAVLAGHGIGYLLEDHVTEHVAAGRLVRALAPWCSTTYPGYYLYHPSRRQTPPALAALITALVAEWKRSG